MFPGELRAFMWLHRQVQSAKQAKPWAWRRRPSAVRIALLEHQIGTTLLYRTSAGVSLTHAGKLVAEYARTVVLDYESLRADLNDRRGSRRRLIVLAVVESAVSGGLVDAIAAFRSKFEAVSFRLNTMPAPQVIDYVKRGECDAGLTFCCPAQPEIVIVASIAEPIVLAVPNDHPLAKATSVSLSDLKDQSLALPELSFGVRRIMDRASHDIGLGSALNPAFSSNSFEALSDFVRRGAGVAVLPRRAALRASTMGHLAIVPIEHQSFQETTIDIITLRKRRIPRIVNDFIQQVTQPFKDG